MNKTHEELSRETFTAIQGYDTEEAVMPIILAAITAAVQAEREQMQRSFQMIVLGIVVRANSNLGRSMTGSEIQELAESELARLSLNDSQPALSE